MSVCTPNEVAAPTITFDGANLATTLSGPDWCVEEIARGGFAAPDVTMWRRAGADGSVFLDATLPPKEITLTIAVLLSNSIDARTAERELGAKLLTSGPRTLRFSDDPAGFTYSAILSDVSLSSSPSRYVRGTLTFTVPDALLTGPQVVLTYPYESPLLIPTNWHVFPRWQFSFTGNVTRFALLKDGIEVYVYDGPITPAQTLVIDTQARETRVGGTLRILEIDGEYPALEASNEVTFAVTGGSIASGSLTYRGAYA